LLRQLINGRSFSCGGSWAMIYQAQHKMQDEIGPPLSSSEIFDFRFIPGISEGPISLEI